MINEELAQYFTSFNEVVLRRDKCFAINQVRMFLVKASDSKVPVVPVNSAATPLFFRSEQDCIF